MNPQTRNTSCTMCVASQAWFVYYTWVMLTLPLYYFMRNLSQRYSSLCEVQSSLNDSQIACLAPHRLKSSTILFVYYHNLFSLLYTFNDLFFLRNSFCLFTPQVILLWVVFYKQTAVSKARTLPIIWKFQCCLPHSYLLVSCYSRNLVAA